MTAQKLLNKKETVIEYINDKIHPFCLNENGKKSVTELVLKFTIKQIITGVDDATMAYLKYNSNGINKEIVNTFLNKIAGVIIVKGMSPTKQKFAYIKGIARNRFQNWDSRDGVRILNNYVIALKNYGYNEEKILNDLENNVIPLTKEIENWSQWREILESWIVYINGESKKLN